MAGRLAEYLAVILPTLPCLIIAVTISDKPLE